MGVTGVSGSVVAVSGLESPPFCVGVGGRLLPVLGLGGVTVPWIASDRSSSRGDARLPLIVIDGDGGMSETGPRPTAPLPFESGRLSGEGERK